MTDSQTLLTALRAHVNVCRDCDMVHGRYCKVAMPLAVRFADIRADQVSAARLLRETAVRLPRWWPQEPWEK